MEFENSFISIDFVTSKWPIPFNEMELNLNLIQNPGY